MTIGRRITIPAYVFKFCMNIWPPYVGAGIHVQHIQNDYRKIIVTMKLKLRNINYFGVHFGGSLYSMTDPFYALMIVHNLPSSIPIPISISISSNPTTVISSSSAAPVSESTTQQQQVQQQQQYKDVNYIVWDKSASIEFVSPGRGIVSAEFNLTDNDIQHIVQQTNNGQKHLHEFSINIKDINQNIVAKVNKIVYIRQKQTTKP